jgi:uncharacterized protein DUF4252
MKRLMPYALGIALLSTSVLVSTGAEPLSPGQVDFGKFSPPGSGSQFVEVNVSGGLISLAARLVEKQEPEVAKLLNGLQLVHVNVIGLDDDNRGDLEKRAQHIRKELDGKGWERIVTAQNHDRDVSVYLKMRDKDAVQGLVVMVMDGKEQAVFVNIVGDIRPEQLALLGEKLHIDPLKKIGRATEK